MQCTQTEVVHVLGSFNCGDLGSHLTNPPMQQIRILHKTNGKYVNLLYMYSILGRGSFRFNYCLNSAWRGGDQFVALRRWYEAQVSLTVAFSSSACFGLLFLIFLLTIPHRFSGVQVWWVCWSVKHTNTMAI